MSDYEWCSRCGGTGLSWVNATNEEQVGHTETCPECNGTGKNPYYTPPTPAEKKDND